eukprot:4700133-Alexandrium_andersonii.AAC.1
MRKVTGPPDQRGIACVGTTSLQQLVTSGGVLVMLARPLTRYPAQKPDELSCDVATGDQHAAVVLVLRVFAAASGDGIADAVHCHCPR